MADAIAVMVWAEAAAVYSAAAARRAAAYLVAPETVAAHVVTDAEAVTAEAEPAPCLVVAAVEH